MVLAEPDDGWSNKEGVEGDGYEAGGYQIRRKDWKDMMECVRRQTTTYWESRMVYLVSAKKYTPIVADF